MNLSYSVESIGRDSVGRGRSNERPSLAFDLYESNVRSYCRNFPSVFAHGANAILTDEQGKQYVDFLAGAGALNYGHNNRHIKDAVVSYLATDSLVHALDLHTPAKRRFLEQFNEVILAPRGYDYKVQFTGPTGTNAVEAAMKLSRKVTGRQTIAAFSGAFHGMSLGSLAVSAREWKRASAGTQLSGVVRLPFDGFLRRDVDSIDVIEDMLLQPGCGADPIAAFIVEVVQAEGGLNVASKDWLIRLAELAKRSKALLIVDDIQAGCGRTGSFFSFEEAGIVPDIVCLSKSIGGLGLPMSIVLIRPELDQWQPGEHNGTFRGNNLAFVAATSALDFWRTPAFQATIGEKAQVIADELDDIVREVPSLVSARRGIGMLQGLSFHTSEAAIETVRKAFELGLIVELCGPRNEVVKVMPPLTIEMDLLREGLKLLRKAIHHPPHMVS